MKKSKYSPEVMERAVRMVDEAGGQYESQWAAITSISAWISCTAETLRRWVRQHERACYKSEPVRTGTTIFYTQYQLLVQSATDSDATGEKKPSAAG